MMTLHAFDNDHREIRRLQPKDAKLLEVVYTKITRRNDDGKPAHIEAGARAKAAPCSCAVRSLENHIAGDGYGTHAGACPNRLTHGGRVTVPPQGNVYLRAHTGTQCLPDSGWVMNGGQGAARYARL